MVSYNGAVSASSCSLIRVKLEKFTYIIFAFQLYPLQNIAKARKSLQCIKL
jgi:hypothetical protein